MPPLVLALSGASGSVIAQRCIQLLRQQEVEVIALATEAAQAVWRQEIGGDFPAWALAQGCRYYASDDLQAPIASGSYPTLGMAVVPCSMGSAAAIATGLSGNLLQRAADVTIKEGRPLVLVPRESPLSVIHLTNLLTLARLGAKILPPVPAFYAETGSVEGLVDQMAHRVLVALGIESELPAQFRYQGPPD